MSTSSHKRNNMPYRAAYAHHNYDGDNDDGEDLFTYPLGIDNNNEYYDKNENWFKSVIRKNATLIVAIIVILCFQFQEPLSSLFRRAVWTWNRFEIVDDEEYRNIGLIEYFQELFIRMCVSISDYGRIAWYTVAELIRNMVWGLSSLVSTISVGGDGRTVMNRAAGPRYRRKPAARNRIYSLPELEDVNTNHNTCTDDSAARCINNNDTNLNLLSKKEFSSPQLNIALDELEAAFLSDKDFPIGWMVYHPTLGVVAKSVADKHNKIQTQEKEKQLPKHSVEKEEPDKSISTITDVDTSEFMPLIKPLASISAVETETKQTERKQRLESHADTNRAKEQDADTQTSGLPVLRSIVAT